MPEKPLKTNLNLKILSLIFAILLWFFVHLTQSTAGPVMGESSVKVPLEIENLAPSLAVLDAPASVFLTVKRAGISLRRQSLKSSDFKASVDLDGKKAGAFRDLPVHAAAPVGFVITGIIPENAEVVVDRESDKTVPLRWKAAEEKMFDKISMTPPTVVVKGPESKVQQVTSAEVQIPDNISSDTTELELSPIPEDILSRPEENVTVIPQTIVVSLHRANGVKPVVIQPVLTGSLPADVILETVSVSPATLLVKETDPTKAVNHLDTTSINLNAIAKTHGAGASPVTQQVSAVVPAGVKVLGNESITVTIQLGARTH